MPLFSTIIAAYNRGPLIRATVDSALSQSIAGENEIIVVNDGSTDDTADVLASYGSEIRVIHQLNSGPGPARNAGIAQARGQYICFLDSDDLWFPLTLETYRNLIQQHNDPALFVAAAAPFTNPLPMERYSSMVPNVDVFADFYSSCRLALWHGCSAIIVRSDALRDAGGFAAQHINAEDTDLLMKLGTAAGFIRIRTPITVGYRRHNDSAVSNVDRTLAGMEHLIHQESTGRYPGGTARAAERRIMLTRHLRPAILGALAAGRRKEAWRLYRDSFRWNLRQRRAKFLAGFFLKALH